MNYKPTKPLSLSEYPVPPWSVQDAVKNKVREDEFRLRNFSDNEIRLYSGKKKFELSAANIVALARDMIHSIAP